MNQPLAIIISLVAAYFLGSFPSAYLMGRLRKGIDIRSSGEGPCFRCGGFSFPSTIDIEGKGPGEGTHTSLGEAGFQRQTSEGIVMTGQDHT